MRGARYVSMLGLWMLGLVGCGAAAAPDARGARTLLAESLERGDAVTLAALTETEPERLSPPLSDAREELAERGRVLSTAPLEETARIYLQSGSVVVLVREDDRWVVDRGTLGAPALATPLEALSAFAHALARVRAARVTAVLARGTRVLFADELDRWQRGLADVSAIPIVIEGERATATLPTGVFIDLVLEGGEWRIEDVRQ